MRNPFSAMRGVVFVLGLLLAVASIALYHHRARAVPTFARSDSGTENLQTNPSYGEARQLATLNDPNVKESSGLVASRTNPGLYWTHNDSGVTTLKNLGKLNIPGFFGGSITDGSISPDSRRVVLCDYTKGYEIVLPSTSSDFDSIWKQSLTALSLGSRKQGEALTYRLDGRALLATSEGYPMPLIEILRK